MPSGSDLEYAVERLQRAAVDAYMCGPAPSMTDDAPGAQISADQSTYQRGPMHWYRNKVDGAVIGQPVDPTLVDTDFSVKCYDIIMWIERIVDRWRKVPDPSASGKLGTLYTQFHTNVWWRFQEGIVDGGDTKFPYDGEGSLIQNVGDAWRSLMGKDKNENGKSDEDEGLQGATAMVFKDFYQKFTNAIMACRDIVTVIDSDIKSEMDLWVNARHDAAQTVHAIAGVCERLATGAGKGPQTTDVAGVFSDASFGTGLVSLIPGPQSVPVAIASTGLSVVSDALGRGFSPVDYVTPPRKAIPDYSSAIEVLSLLMNGSAAGVDQRVTATEQAIDHTLCTAAIMVRVEGRSRFDPTPEPITEAVPSKIKYDSDIAATVFTCLNSIGDELSEAAHQVQLCRDLPSDALRRHERIGIGADGPYDSLDLLMSLLKMLLDDLAAEAYKAAANFKAAMDLLSGAETNAQTLIQAAADFNSTGSGEFVTYESEHPISVIDIFRLM